MFLVGYLLLRRDGSFMGVITTRPCPTSSQFSEPAVAPVEDHGVARFDPRVLGGADVRAVATDDAEDENALVAESQLPRAFGR